MRSNSTAQNSITLVAASDQQRHTHTVWQAHSPHSSFLPSSQPT
jgi:hypothetical protein